MSIEEQHVALPKLYGAPAYARPPRVVDDTPRPFDPDDLPIAACQTDEERAFAAELPARPYLGMARSDEARSGSGGQLTGRPFRLRSLADRLLRGSGN